MIEPSVPRQVVRTLPKYRWGQPVTAAVDLYNDGSVPDLPEDVLLVAAGGPGEIVRVGRHEEADLPVYIVDFGVAVLGCFENELTIPGDSATAMDPIAPEAAP